MDSGYQGKSGEQENLAERTIHDSGLLAKCENIRVLNYLDLHLAFFQEHLSGTSQAYGDGPGGGQRVPPVLAIIPQELILPRKRPLNPRLNRLNEPSLVRATPP